jgi:hypothetical protein
MSQTVKAAYFNALKDAGVKFDKHYREYSTEELKAAYLKLSEGVDLDIPTETVPDLPPLEEPPPPGFFGFEGPPPEDPPAPSAEVKAADPNEMAGQRQNSQPVDKPIRIDPETGREWYQEEVLKPAYPKPRGRRVLTYLEKGVKEERVRAGQFVETFEVAGDEVARVAEVKITLPSYQVGIFRDPRFPFKVHTYNGLEGFDLFEVRDYYGGAELVPEMCKLVYVENVLCYDIRSVVRAIEAEYRQLQLTGKVQP